MRIVNFHEHNYNQIGASGDCPHCPAHSYFRPVASYIESVPTVSKQRIVSAAQCENCKGFVLVVGERIGQSQPSNLVAVFPLGKPSDSVDPSVPEEIAADFKEALRCQWINAFKACVVMCRRTIQASAIALGASGTRLIDQVDDLFAKGRITEALKSFAHEVRLTGNVGAHPDADGLNDVAEEDAADIVEFTREYLHHVYVMPAKLQARRKPTGG